MAVATGRSLRQPQAGVANIRGERHYLWRAVDHEGEVLESYVTKKRDKVAALKFLRKAKQCNARGMAIRMSS
jgi:transposase-like protein